MTTINEKTIEEIAERSATAEAFFNYAASREREIREGVSRLSSIKSQMAKEGFHPISQDLLAVFKALEHVGAGSLKNDEFHWSVSIKDIGKLTAKHAKKPVGVGETPVQKSLVVYFENNKRVALSFPPTLTKPEVDFVLERLLKECG